MRARAVIKIRAAKSGLFESVRSALHTLSHKGESVTEQAARRALRRERACKFNGADVRSRERFIGSGGSEGGAFDMDHFNIGHA